MEKQRMEFVIRELQQQFGATLEMLTLAVDNCPTQFWDRIFGDNSPFCRETYHTLFYIRNHTIGLQEKRTGTPFGVDIDPTFENKATGTIPRNDILAYIQQTREHIDSLFAELTIDKLGSSDNYSPTRFRSVYHRLIYGLRHGQHHVGKLTGYLFCNGVDYDPWRG